jgi:hypothetical protein
LRSVTSAADATDEPNSTPPRRAAATKPAARGNIQAATSRIARSRAANGHICAANGSHFLVFIKLTPVE